MAWVSKQIATGILPRTSSIDIPVRLLPLIGGRRLRISTGRFYLYFKSKDDLFIQVVGEVVRNTITEVEKVIRKKKNLFKRSILRAEALNANFTNFSAILTQLRAGTVSQRKWIAFMLDLIINGLTLGRDGLS